MLISMGFVKLLTDVRGYYPNREDFDFSRGQAQPSGYLRGRGFVGRGGRPFESISSERKDTWQPRSRTS
jgi:hypothetical protein